ncbi:LysE family translocator [Virgisporangium aurantiacum]|uniref:Lysine transporter LysE n=1 Tax=Virgisporangium aurantiacum TaxID=175570 RepID=A0A8J3ZHH8_9ACTN|nr:LysE family translocator [Virgisporangium aurantiacum]GIJ64279.1 lysine transporter LysE [Virgisporangium aurantiacum]
MVDVERLAAFVAMAFVIIVIPGPSVLFVIGRALSYGRRIALITVAGNTAGAYLALALVALGVGSVVERSLVAFTVLKLLGAAYLVYLGVQAFRHRRTALSPVPDAEPVQGTWRTLWQGLIVGVSNPKSFVFYAAVLPQFVDRSAGHVTVQMLLLGLCFTLMALVCDGLWGLTAAGARNWFARSPRRLAAVGGTGGLAMIGLGVTVALTGRKD